MPVIAILLLSSDHVSLIKVLWKLNLKNKGDESKTFSGSNPDTTQHRNVSNSLAQPTVNIWQFSEDISAPCTWINLRITLLEPC
jgi:hypothetical protein